MAVDVSDTRAARHFRQTGRLLQKYLPPRRSMMYLKPSFPLMAESSPASSLSESIAEWLQRLPPKRGQVRPILLLQRKGTASWSRCFHRATEEAYTRHNGWVIRFQIVRFEARFQRRSDWLRRGAPRSAFVEYCQGRRSLPPDGQGNGGRERQSHCGQCRGTAAAPLRHALKRPQGFVAAGNLGLVRAPRPCPSTSYLLHGPPSLGARLSGLCVLSPCGRGGIGRRTSLRC